MKSHQQLLNDDPDYHHASLAVVRSTHKIVLTMGSGRIPLPTV